LDDGGIPQITQIGRHWSSRYWEKNCPDRHRNEPVVIIVSPRRNHK